MEEKMKPNCSAAELTYFAFSNQQICGYSNIFFCLTGTVFNSLVVVVYTRKNMISPMNTIFTHVAIVDVLVLVSWLPHTWHHLIRSNLYSIKEHRTKFWETVSHTSLHITAVFMYASMSFSLVMALWRYIAILHPLKERRWCSMKSTKIAIFLCYMMGFLIILPSYLWSDVLPLYKILNRDGFLASSCHTGNRTMIYGSVIKLPGVWYQAHLLFYGVIAKIAPSVVLSIIICRIIIALHKAKKCHRKMTETSTTCPSRPNNNSHHTERERQTNRITTILLILLGLFIIGELPHGLGCLLSVVLGKEFYAKYYYPSMQIFNSIRMFCTSIHFLVYYTLSKQFRDTFKALLSGKPFPIYRTSTSGTSNTVLTGSQLNK